jgi:predicted metal-binding membrane protein
MTYASPNARGHLSSSCVMAAIAATHRAASYSVFATAPYCVGCCWALMALLLVGGVMNVLWIVLLALLAFLERVTSMGRLIARLAGIVLVAGGAWLFSMGMS